MDALHNTIEPSAINSLVKMTFKDASLGGLLTRVATYAETVAPPMTLIALAFFCKPVKYGVSLPFCCAEAVVHIEVNSTFAL